MSIQLNVSTQMTNKHLKCNAAEENLVHTPTDVHAYNISPPVFPSYSMSSVPYTTAEDSKHAVNFNLSQNDLQRILSMNFVGTTVNHCSEIYSRTFKSQNFKIS